MHAKGEARYIDVRLARAGLLSLQGGVPADLKHISVFVPFPGSSLDAHTRAFFHRPPCGCS